MAHIQQQILDAVRAALLAAPQTDAAGDVQLDAVDPLPKALTAAIRIEEMPEGESVSDLTIHGAQQRALLVRVDCIVRLTGAFASAARELGLQVEKRLTTDAALAALCQPEIQASALAKDGEGDRPLAARRQVWRLTYYCQAETPDVPLSLNP